MVRKLLQDLSGFPPDTGVNPVIAVALGAALYSHMLDSDSAPKAIHLKPASEGRTQPHTSAAQVHSRPATHGASPAHEGIPAPKSLDLPRVRFVTAHGVGVRLVTSVGRILNQVLIPRNSSVPASANRRFLTQSNKGYSDRLKITVTQGDADDPELVEVLGTLYISGLPPEEPGRQPVDVSMSFDAQGRLNINAVYLNTGHSLQQSLEIPGCLREEEVRQYRKILQDTGLVRKKPPSTGSLAEIVLDDEDDYPLLDPI
jgi:molecular chaperone DnaK (HSP70)